MMTAKTVFLQDLADRDDDSKDSAFARLELTEMMTAKTVFLQD